MNETTREEYVRDPGKMEASDKHSNEAKRSGEVPVKGGPNNPSTSCEPLSVNSHTVGAFPCPLPTPRNGSHPNVTSPSTKTSNAKNSLSSMSHGWGSGSGSNSRSDSLDSTSSAPLKPHTGGDVRWDAITCASSRESPLGLTNFRLLKRLGYGDIGSVYLVELRGSATFYAMKVMDKASLASRNKLLRAQTEREILGLLDHPFLPTLYSYFETEKFYCLVMEFCSGGNLHSLRQKQPNKHFTEEAARLLLTYSLLSFFLSSPSLILSAKFNYIFPLIVVVIVID